MIGSGLKKFALQHGMKIANGVAYGNFWGFGATLSEGAGFKQIFLTTRFATQEQKERFMAAVNTVDLSRTYRVQSLNISERVIQIVFTDNPGTMKKLQEFTDWFMPLLQQHGAAPMQICSECGMEVTNGKWVLIDGIAYYLHEACAQKVAREIDGENTRRKEEDTGSYLTGTIGAFLGAIVGSIAWALVLQLGYVASIVGFLIGWLADKGYTLLKGKQGKGKIAILIIAVIFGVVLGCFLGDAIAIAQLISSGEAADLAYGDIPALIIVMLIYDSEYASAVLGNLVIGLLFAGLGVFSLLRKAGHAVADTKVIELQ